MATIVKSNTTTLVSVKVSQSFVQLTSAEKKYAYHLMRASWLGSRLTFAQVSDNSMQLFRLIRGLLAKTGSAASLRQQLASGAAAGDVDDLLCYFATVVSNAGNFISFGDSKFVPNVPFDRASAILSSMGADADAIWKAVKEDVYAEAGSPVALGFPGESGETGYYQGVATSDEAKRVQALLDAEKVSAINTKLVRVDGSGAQPAKKQKTAATDGSVARYQLQVASVNQLPKGQEGRVLRGDGIEVELKGQLFRDDLALLVRHLRAAIEFASNDQERQMLQEYVSHFETGDIEMHKQSQRTWVKILGPAVEQNIGFVESYRDPIGVRAEFEGLVACNDKQKSALYASLVDKAGKGILDALPWPREFERPSFVSPDYTSLEVIGMAGSGIPIGINIPNYDDIREQVGFKNVTLANIIRAREAVTKYDEYLEDSADASSLERNASLTMDVEVALHELLGHGSGRLFTAEHANKGQLPVDPTTGAKATTFYADGETWSSVFGAVSAPYEECRAEAVALYLCDHPDVAKVFGYTDRVAELVRCVYSSMMISALKGMAFHDGKGKWGQAHCQARFALLKVLVNAGAVEVRPAAPKEAPGANFRIYLAPDFHAKGKAAVGKFLGDLTVHKALRDVKRGTELFNRMSAIDTDFYRTVREDIVSRRKPRPLFVQPDVQWNNGDVQVVEYPNTVDGALDSFLAHYDEAEFH